MDRLRLDTLMAKRAMTPSREKARECIAAGDVRVNGRIVVKPAFPVGEDDRVELCPNLLKYVGRGGFKLEHALDAFGIVLEGKTVLDVGASTGGFTDCMLTRGAARIYAVDTGTGQLADRLRKDKRVVSLEGTDIRSLCAGHFENPPDFATADVSFISLSLVASSIYTLTSADSEAVFLIKPQFESGRNEIGKNGIVKDKKVHVRAIENVLDSVTGVGYRAGGLTHSPIRGKSGNIEYLLFLRHGGRQTAVDVHGTVETAFSFL